MRNTNYGCQLEKCVVCSLASRTMIEGPLSQLEGRKMEIGKVGKHRVGRGLDEAGRGLRISRVYWEALRNHVKYMDRLGYRRLGVHRESLKYNHVSRSKNPRSKQIERNRAFKHTHTF